ncbi:MAG: L-aspartate oxidase [Planctomycetes bacterium]|nr:L-aspartate oxidase [Planctomycetota bacterium]NUQ34744.1 L-aspartate oxidase [Planctomycetaceae bacterium]
MQPQTQPLAALPRYLTAFDSRTLPVEETDVLIIGGGVAGLSTAIEAARGGKRVVLLCKGDLTESNTHYAQGGIAATLTDDRDAIEEHYRDTIAAGDGLCDEAVVRAVVEGAPEAIRFLQQGSCAFDRNEEGELDIAREGAHSRARVLHAGGDATGREIARALVGTARKERRLRCEERSFVIDLLTVGDGTADQRCVGALVVNGRDMRLVLAGAVVLATGGIGRLYRESSNPKVATGDGHAMALRAGVVLRDLELVQFHPTLAYVAGAPRVLITEALRGAGAVLRNSAGERFMTRYDERLELAPRDVLARSITQELERVREAAVFLDVTHLSKEKLAHFPGFAALCNDYDIDISRSWVPVRPGPHYMIGGIKSDTEGRTSLRDFYAVGEAASSGLHGANRLASNSLLEGVVLGRKLGRALAGAKLERPRDIELSHNGDESLRKAVGVDFYDLRNAFRSAMWRGLGVARNASGVTYLLKRIEGWHKLIMKTRLSDQRAWALANMVELGHAMACSALARDESRGAHYRTDFPHHRSEYAHRHIEYTREHGARWDQP